MFCTPDYVSESSNKQITTALLHSTTIRVEIHMAHGLPRPKATEYQIFPIAVNHVDEFRIRLVEPGSWILRFEQWTSGI